MLCLFCRNQNLHISQTLELVTTTFIKFCRNQNLHISQTTPTIIFITWMFCRNQNLHISQTSKLRFGVEILNLSIKKWIDTNPGPKAI